MNKVDLVVDIETLVIPVTKEEREAAMAAYVPPANYKSEEALAKHKEEFLKELPQKILDDKRFSLGGKRMISAALGRVDNNGVQDIECWCSESLEEITTGFVDYLNSYREYRLIGWNHKKFDLPEIAKSLAKTGVRPKVKPTKWDLIDLCEHPFRGVKMKEVAKGLGLPIMEVDGSNVAELYKEGNFELIKEYNKHDVFLTGSIFHIMNSIFTF